MADPGASGAAGATGGAGKPAGAESPEILLSDGRKLSESRIAELERLEREAKLDGDWRKRNTREAQRIAREREETRRLAEEVRAAVAEFRSTGRSPSGSGEQEVPEDVQRILEGPDGRALSMLIQQAMAPFSPLLEEHKTRAQRAAIEAEAKQIEDFTNEVKAVAEGSGVSFDRLWREAAMEEIAAKREGRMGRPLEDLAWGILEAGGKPGAAEAAALGTRTPTPGPLGSAGGGAPAALSEALPVPHSSDKKGNREWMQKRIAQVRAAMGLGSPAAG